MCLLPVVGADVCLEERGLGGTVWRRKASANESTQDRTSLVLPKSIKRMNAIRSRVPTHQSFFLALSDSGNTIGQQQCPHSWQRSWSSDPWTKFVGFLAIIFCIGTTSQNRKNCGIGVSDVFLIGARGFVKKVATTIWSTRFANRTLLAPRISRVQYREATNTFASGST